MKSRSAYLVLAVGLILVTAWLGMLLWNAGRPNAVGAARLGPPAHYVLTDTQGHAITEYSFPGRLRLVFFGFASCADVCPATLAKLRPALAALGKDADRVQPLFISVDPDRDTPERLARYVQTFDARILGATGSPAQLRAFARSYGVYVNVDNHAAGSIAYSVTHTSSLLLIGPGGVLLGVVDSRVPAIELAARLRQQLQKNYSYSQGRNGAGDQGRRFSSFAIAFRTQPLALSTPAARTSVPPLYRTGAVKISGNLGKDRNPGWTAERLEEVVTPLLPERPKG